jgi:hypothetical protein
LEISLFIFYLLLLSYFITIIPFFKTSGIRSLHIVTLFAIKVLAGVGYGLFYTLPSTRKVLTPGGSTVSACKKQAGLNATPLLLSGTFLYTDTILRAIYLPGKILIGMI